MYQIFLRTFMILHEFINIRTAKYDAVLDTLHALDNKESHDAISFHSLHCKVSGFYYLQYFNAFWLWDWMSTKYVHLVHIGHK